MAEDTSVEIPQNVEQRKTRINQFIATCVVSIISFSQGSFTGWISPVQPLLQSQDTPANFPPIGDEEASWIVSVSSLSPIFVIPVYSYAVDKLGRKRTGYLVAVPFILSWVLTLCADSVGMLFAARCIGGLSAGGAGILVPAYANDIAEDDIRGILGMMYVGSLSSGLLYSYAVGSYVSYMWFNISCLAQPVAFLMAFFWLPEAPLFLVTKGKDEEARKALVWLRNGRDTEEEFLRIKTRAEEFTSVKRKKMQLSDITKRSNWRAVVICIGMMANIQLSGFSAVLTYAVTIFAESGSSSLSANNSIIIVGAIKAIGTVLSSVVIERCGRRPLLITSDIISSVCLLLTGTYFYLQNSGSDVNFISWLPVTCLSIFIFFIGLALLPIPFLLSTELPSPKTRGMVQSISVVFASVAAFVTVKTFTSLSHLIGIYGCFWFYGSCCAVCTLFIYFTVPETKNRSSEDIVEQLNSKQYISSIISLEKRTMHLKEQNKNT